MGLLRGAADRQRPPGLPPRARAGVQGHLPALQDDAAATSSSARAAGTATACRSRSPSSRSSASRQGGDRGVRHRRVQRAVPRVGLRYVEEWNRADRADRLLDRPRRRLPDARHRATSSRSGGRSSRCGSKDLLYEGHKVVPYCPRCGTALSSPRGRARATATSRTRASTCASPSRAAAGPLERGRRAARVDDDAVDARLQRRGRRRPRAHVRARGPGRTRRLVLAEALVERVLGEDAEVLARFPGAELRRRRLRAAVRLHRAPRRTGPRATRSWPPTSSPPRTARASSTPPSPSARTTSGSARSTA